MNPQIITYRKGREYFNYVYNVQQGAAILRKVAADAANPELSLDWRDAAIIGAKVRQTLKTMHFSR